MKALKMPKYTAYRHAHALMYNTFEGFHERICVCVRVRACVRVNNVK
jgi:hypothetical protein